MRRLNALTTTFILLDFSAAGWMSLFKLLGWLKFSWWAVLSPIWFWWAVVAVGAFCLCVHWCLENLERWLWQWSK